MSVDSTVSMKLADRVGLSLTFGPGYPVHAVASAAHACVESYSDLGPSASPDVDVIFVKVSVILGEVRFLHVTVADLCGPVRTTGSVCAWGGGSAGDLGNGGTADSSVPVQVQGLIDITAIAAGDAGYALRADGTVDAWGAGRLGNGGTADSSVPVQVWKLNQGIAIAGGILSGYAVLRD